MNRPPIAIALHGGAGVVPGRDYARAEAHLRSVAEAAGRALEEGQSALDAVEDAVRALEASGYYVAGRGSAPNAAGVVELEASIMDGARRRAGAVCAVRDVVHPVAAARAVMERTPHVLLAGEGAMAFVAEAGLARVTDPGAYYRLPIGVEAEDIAVAMAHGTVGAAALDREGRLAAATSTGGLFGKRPGRIGDSALIGAGAWADRRVAISCTGVGEYFILAGGAQDVASRMVYAGADVQSACEGMIADVGRLGGDGGVIAVDADGRVAFAFNSPGLKRAAYSTQGGLMSAVDEGAVRPA